MSTLGRRGLLKTLGLAPLARGGKHKHRETPVGWTNQAFQLLIVNAADGSFSGAFVYSPGPGNGNLIASIAATAGTDPYGNAYVDGVASYAGNSGARLFNGSVQFLSFIGGSWINAGLIGAGGASGIMHISPLTDAYFGLSSGDQVVIGPVGLTPDTAALLEVQGDLALTEQSSAPPTPTGAGVLYTDSTGHLHYLGPGGTNTTLAGP